MAVLGMVSAVAGFVKVRYLIDKAIIDNVIFRCHYRITSAILFVCCIIVTANNLIGDPISCINDGAIPGHVINTYCWITYTFTIPGLHGANVGTHVAQSGVGPEADEEKTYHSYYQWVPFMLFFQGVMFYFPHWVWKNWEDGKMRMISDGVRGAITMSDSDKSSHISRLIKYISQSYGTHNSYSFGYFISEALNFVNVILNIFMVDKFLGGAFMTYGTDVLRFSGMNQENRSDPMVEVFPRITKCTFHKYGASGGIQKHDAMCVLALNILNEKIYIFLWFWFIVLAVLSGLALAYSAVIVLMPTTREIVFKRRIGTNKTHDNFFKFISKCEIGDFLMLHLLSQNINAKVFREVVNKLSRNNRSQSPIGTPSAPSTLNMTPPGIEMEPINPLLTMEEEKKRKGSM